MTEDERFEAWLRRTRYIAEWTVRCGRAQPVRGPGGLMALAEITDEYADEMFAMATCACPEHVHYGTVYPN